MTRAPEPGLCCPKCGYDLSGTPGSTCPECGEPFDRAQLRRFPQDIREPVWVDAPLALAILVGMMGWGFGRYAPHAQLYQMVWCGAVWTLTMAWVSMRRTTLLQKPHTALWLVAAAIVAPNRPDLQPPLGTIVQGFSLAVGGAAALYAFIGDPARAILSLARAVAVILMWLGVFFLGIGVPPIFEYVRGNTVHLDSFLAVATGLTLGVIGWCLWIGIRRMDRSR